MTELISQLALKSLALLGENPCWHQASASLFWLDGLKGQLLEQAHIRFQAEPSQVMGGLVRCEQGWLFGLEQQLLLLADGNSQPQLVCDLPLNHDEHVNDACCDAQGRLWLSTKHKDCRPGAGKLLRLDQQGCQVLLTGLTVPNGSGFSPENHRFYLVESSERQVFSYEFDLASGCLGSSQKLLDFSEQQGFPDGLAIDVEGRLWLAHWAGSCVTAWTEDGHLEARITLPTSKVTSLCFGGNDLDTLYITTAQKDLSAADLLQEPLAGSIFSLKPGSRGLVRYPAKLSLIR